MGALLLRDLLRQHLPPEVGLEELLQARCEHGQLLRVEVFLGGETRWGGAVGPQPRCPSTRSLWTRRLPPPISQPLLRQRARIGLGDRGVGGLGCSPPRRWAPLTSRTWSTISCMTSHWASVSLKRRSERNRQGRRWQQRQDRAGRAGTSTALGAGGGLGAVCCSLGSAPRRRDVPTMLLRLAEAPPLITDRVRTGVLASEAAPPPAQAP